MTTPTPPYRAVAKPSKKCSRCGDTVSDRTPPEGRTMEVGLTATITTTTWKLRLRRFRWVWLPKDPRDRVNETYATLDVCDWCAGDVFLFAQGRSSGDCQHESCRPAAPFSADNAQPEWHGGPTGFAPKPSWLDASAAPQPNDPAQSQPDH